jgi:hypothetical protein
MTSTKFTYASVKSSSDIKEWLTESTQTPIYEEKTFTDNKNNIWIQNYEIKIGFNWLLIFKLKDSDLYSCHTTMFGVTEKNFPDIGIYNSYNEMITKLVEMYTKLWKLN